MKKITFVIFLIVLAIACQRKSVPVITERKSEPENTKTLPASTTIAPDTLIGKTVFVNRCGKCHGLPDPNQFTAKRWDAILLSMMPKARLNNEQEIHVTAYVMTNAAK